jgi:hypothetical protein
MISRTSGGSFGKRWNSVSAFWGRETTAAGPLFLYSRLRSFIFGGDAFLTGQSNDWESSKAVGTINIVYVGKGPNLPVKLERNL